MTFLLRKFMCMKKKVRRGLELHVNWNWAWACQEIYDVFFLIRIFSFKITPAFHLQVMAFLLFSRISFSETVENSIDILVLLSTIITQNISNFLLTQSISYDKSRKSYQFGCFRYLTGQDTMHFMSKVMLIPLDLALESRCF